MLHNKRGRNSERPAHRDEEWPPLAAARESSYRNEDPTQLKLKKQINKILKKTKKKQKNKQNKNRLVDTGTKLVVARRGGGRLNRGRGLRGV